MDQPEQEISKNTQITVAWWNTSLAPRGESRECKDLRAAATGVLTHLASKYSADFIALGEMSETDLSYLVVNFPLSGWVFRSGVTQVGKTQYDTSYAYNSGTFELVSIEDISDISAGRTLKVAQRLNLIEKHSGKNITIFASHWPSRLNTGELHPHRDILGIRLRDAAREVKSTDNSEPHIILLGDYNDEPFSRSLNDHLMASRDRAHVSRRKDLFYNPFWSFMGKREGKDNHPLGSYYWKDGLITRWLTLDQIILSRSFICGDDWNLLENGNRLVDIPELTELVKNRSSKFDHIPVCATFAKEIVK